MDFLFTRGESVDDSAPKHDVFDGKYTGDLLDENWTNPNDLLDSIFSMDNDFLNSYDQTRGFETLDDLSHHIKMEMEAEEYKISNTSYPETNGIDCNPTVEATDNEFGHNISSNSSDSGLSSDNLDVEMSPTYEPLSPAMSSPGPSISERGEKKDFGYETEIVSSTKPIIAESPKVIVKKIPQIVTLPTNKITTQKLNIANGKEIKIVKLSPHLLNGINNKKVTIQVKNSNSGGKIQTSPGTFFINNGKLTEVTKLVRVQNISNPRSVLLPVSIQDVKDLKTFKIINTSAIKTEVSKHNTANIQATYTNKNIAKPKTTFMRAKPQDDSMSDNTSDAESYVYEDVSSDNLKQHSISGNTSYPKLILTAEEKRLLAKEGIALPTRYPLTKHEERELKRIRRKIRNKISAQDSRKRKKEYVDGLEERVKQCTEENQTLMKRIKLLQSQNHNLMSQMKKLQTLLSKGTNKTAQPTTCLMVLLLSLALIAAPNLKLGQNLKESELEEAVQDTILQNRRNLLFDANTQNSDILDEEINMSEIFSANDREFITLGENCKSASLSYEPRCKKPKFIDFDVDDMNWYQSNEVEKLQKSPNTFQRLAEEFQENKKTQQTSGFNINSQLMDESLLDKDVLDMISPKSNDLYELNIEKLIDLHNGGAILDVTTKYVYSSQTDEKLNSSELRHVQKY